MRLANAAVFSTVLASFASFAVAAPPTVGGCQVFPSNSHWNTPVDTLPVHASSAAWVATIGNTARLHADWGNVLADNYGIPFTTVTGSQPLVPILPDPNESYAVESDPGPYPIPANAPIEGGPNSTGDRHVIVIETTSCRLYELYNATPVNGGAAWTATSYAKYDLASNVLRPAGWTSADAAGLPIFPGLVRWEEVAAGEIAHAIRFTAVNIWGLDAATNQPKYLWPARHWSGSSTLSTRPPMGARFRLKASFDISGFSAPTQVILRAMKKYGLILADAGSNWFFQGVSDTSWPDAVFTEIGSIEGSNFEAVDTSVMMVGADSGQAQLPGAANPPHLAGISTRMQVLTGNDVAIAGFIIGGSSPKTVVVRARGPSLGVPGSLADPMLTLVPANGAPQTANDDWGNAANASAVAASGYAPGDAKEAAIMATLDPGAYTAIVNGAGSTTGVAIVEVYELDGPAIPTIGISTRGRVGASDNVMIAGFIIQGDGPQTVLVRARGASLGVAGSLADPTLTLVPASGAPPIANDDWGTTAYAATLAASGFAPSDAKESAILVTLDPGAYTAIVSGVGGTTGVAIVEVYRSP